MRRRGHGIDDAPGAIGAEMPHAGDDDPCRDAVRRRGVIDAGGDAVDQRGVVETDSGGMVGRGEELDIDRASPAQAAR